MSRFTTFSLEDVREINRNVIAKKSHASELSEGSQRILRDIRFSRDEINQAFAAARKRLRLAR